MGKRQSNSRPARWDRAVAAAQTALEVMQSAKEDFDAAIDELEELRSEYEEWKENLPENLANSALGEKLEAISGLDVENAKEGSIDDMENALGELESPDFPMGFGKD